MSEIREIFQKTFKNTDFKDIIQSWYSDYEEPSEPLQVHYIDNLYKYPEQVVEWYKENIKNQYVENPNIDLKVCLVD